MMVSLLTLFLKPIRDIYKSTSSANGIVQATIIDLENLRNTFRVELCQEVPKVLKSKLYHPLSYIEYMLTLLRQLKG